MDDRKIRTGNQKKAPGRTEKQTDDTHYPDLPPRQPDGDGTSEQCPWGITSEDLDYSKFLDMVNNDGVQEVVLKSGTLTVTPKDQKSEGITYQVTMMGDEQELVDLLQEKGITYHKDPPDSTGTIIYTLLTVILPVVMLVAVMVWVMRSMNKGGGVMGVGKEQSKGLRTERNRRDIPRCCGTGRGKRIAPGGCGFPA